MGLYDFWWQIMHRHHFTIFIQLAFRLGNLMCFEDYLRDVKLEKTGTSKGE